MNNMGGLAPPPPPYPGYSPQQNPNPVAGPPPQPPQPPNPGTGGISSAPPSPFHQPQTLQQQKTPAEIEADKQKLRFVIELEFVQCLGNPNYLNFLAQRGYFKEPTFINYLKYLNYWRTHPYVRFLKFPVCLHFLELLQHESFRKEIVNAQVIIHAFIIGVQYKLFHQS
uniref:Mediator of RNA polymerase II transcription subunit 31 n=1 Tax=Lepeophtheirus salmonis TaxID=72036 RepID=A0A0K2USR9_LEPSM